jgi:microcystin-dependent protein
MSILWERSLVPWLDASGAPYSGAKAYFYDAGTLTPIVTYTDAALSIPNDHPVIANSGGAFGPIFLPEQIIYHLRIEDAGGSTIWDVDGISAPTTVVPDPPSGGTDTQYLMVTGDIKSAWRASTPTGFVRCNGRTIGGVSSGATERANADCSALFQFLWTEDATLTVSGGRGATAAGDWAAAKTIALPDLRGRALIGLDGMGAADANRVVDADTTGTNSNVLGAVGGENRHALITAELAAHNHTINITDPGHTHTMPQGQSNPGSPATYTSGDDYTNVAFNSPPTGSSTTGITAASVNTGSGTAHNNLQPFAMVQFFIKL